MSLTISNPSESFKLKFNNELFNNYFSQNYQLKNKLIFNNQYIVIIILIIMKSLNHNSFKSNIKFLQIYIIKILVHLLQD